ncbi:MAG: hypothetical protein ACLQO6_14990 [Desulfomonilaceae bacterium]
MKQHTHFRRLLSRFMRRLQLSPEASASKTTPLGQEDLTELAPLVRKMADTGIGTDACLEIGCLPMLVHFYPLCLISRT